ncbi:hypothetical protein RINTHH_22040 [Richelia intracellularis HH01]|uniref:Uncharacterized protein n=1 Tax=Richelia intracellularis HH01 TaxID=1165094 RepID=M1WTT1_9NOST|nr:hypothetical protein RINTHH_22040 [Richelia intracellularis HH01]
MFHNKITVIIIHPNYGVEPCMTIINHHIIKSRLLKETLAFNTWNK